MITAKDLSRITTVTMMQEIRFSPETPSYHIGNNRKNNICRGKRTKDVPGRAERHIYISKVPVVIYKALLKLVKHFSNPGVET